MKYIKVSEAYFANIMTKISLSSSVCDDEQYMYMCNKSLQEEDEHWMSLYNHNYERLSQDFWSYR